MDFIAMIVGPMNGPTTHTADSGGGGGGQDAMLIPGGDYFLLPGGGKLLLPT